VLRSLRPPVLARLPEELPWLRSGAAQGSAAWLELAMSRRCFSPASNDRRELTSSRVTAMPSTLQSERDPLRDASGLKRRLPGSGSAAQLRSLAAQNRRLVYSKPYALKKLTHLNQETWDGPEEILNSPRIVSTDEPTHHSAPCCASIDGQTKRNNRPRQSDQRET